MTRQARLLVVDDSELNRDALSRRLLQRGYLVEVAASGPEALARIRSERFDLILLDVEMPAMSGLDVLSELRQTRSRTDLPVIMVTARSEGDDIVEAFRLGANDYVTKPIDVPVLLARLGTHLSHKWAVEDLRESQERYELAVRGANDGLWDWNLATSEVYWSPRWKAMFGYAESEIGSSPEEWLSRVHYADAPRVRASLEAHINGGGEQYESEHRMMHRDGTVRWVRCRGAAVRRASGEATRLAGSVTDITDGKVADTLTGLPNRLLFMELVDRSIKRTERRKGYGFALLVFGLDRFKAVNASLGLLKADRLLVSVAGRLQASLRSTDCVAHGEHSFTLARLGGDEFTILLDDVGEPSDAMRIAERLRAELQSPFVVEGQPVFTSAAVGIAMSTSGYRKPEDILRDAVIALERAKASGKPSCEIFDPAMREGAIARLNAEVDLRNAVDARGLSVHYQPIVSLETGEITSFEALARWHHPVRGAVSPTEFIPLAESTGMIRDIARFMLREACRQMVEWRERFGAAAPRTVAVNVSSLQFNDGALVDEIRDALAETGMDGSALKLEITESAFIGDVDAAQATLGRAQSIGVAFSLDDFGTGYSSLSYLHRLQVGTVKVDRSFVSRVASEVNAGEMVRAIVAMTHNLGMDLVAEGVETEEQLAHIRSLGCDAAQGFYFSPAVGAAAATELIAAQPWRHDGGPEPAEPEEALQQAR